MNNSNDEMSLFELFKQLRVFNLAFDEMMNDREIPLWIRCKYGKRVNKIMEQEVRK